MLKKQYLIIILIATLVFVIDRASKEYLVPLLYSIEGRQIEVLPFFDLVMVWNWGVSFGLFQNPEYGKFIFPAIAFAISVFIFIWCNKKFNETKKMYFLIALSLILAGAFGNSYDRIVWGAVADFFYFNYGRLFFPAFNVADVAIFFGAVILLIDSFKNDAKKTT